MCVSHTTFAMIKDIINHCINRAFFLSTTNLFNFFLIHCSLILSKLMHPLPCLLLRFYLSKPTFFYPHPFNNFTYWEETTSYLFSHSGLFWAWGKVISISLHIIFMSKKIFLNLKGYQDLLFSGYCYYSADIDMFKVNSRNTSTRCEVCSRLTINTPERRKWRRSGVFIGNFKHISHLVLLFLLLTLSS